MDMVGYNHVHRRRACLLHNRDLLDMELFQSIRATDPLSWGTTLN